MPVIFISGWPIGPGHPQASTVDSGHGRKEHRKAVVVSAEGLAEHHEFSGLKAFGRIEADRDVDEKTSSETRYFALSWIPEPEVLLAMVRAHWAIENALHWRLDVSFREDASRNRKDNAPGNIAVLRRRALDVVRQYTSKGSLSIKLKRAGWDETFLCSVLSALKEPAPERCAKRDCPDEQVMAWRPNCLEQFWFENSYCG